MAINLSRDTRLRLFGPLFLFAFGTFFFRLSVYTSNGPHKVVQFASIAISCGYIGWEIARLLIGSIQRRYPGIHRTRQRLIILGFLVVLLANANATLRVFINWLLGTGLWKVDLYTYIETTGIQVVYVCVHVAVYEGQYLIQQLQKTTTEKEQLIKAEWQARFDSLKSQVNPHFLFNALNALSTLIDESPAQAGQFVDELSKVYRYLLQSNDRELTPLYTELRFIQSYAHLLKTRHGSGVAIHTSIPENCLMYSLPPLTLQLLVENAVKHNVVSPDRPLLIYITTSAPTDEIPHECHLLLVRNNLQRKKKRGLSNGVGLANIAAKYRMLTQADIVIQEEHEQFTVVLPLLGPVEATT